MSEETDKAIEELKKAREEKEQRKEELKRESEERDELKKEMHEEAKEKIAKGTEGFKHVETKVLTTEHRTVLRCEKCGQEDEFPVHCLEIMSHEEKEFVCTECGHKEPISVHCGEPMKVVIK